MSITGIGKIKREEFMLFMDVSSTATREWELIGSGVEDLSIALNPNVETVVDVTGAVTTTLDRYEEQTDVTPMRAKRESKLFAILYDIIKNRKTLSDVEHTFLCVNVFDVVSDGVYAAWIQKGVVAVQSYGGNTQGLDIPFNIHWIGEKIHGTFTPATGTFTPDTGATYLVTFGVVDELDARIAGAQIVVNNTILSTDALGFASINLAAGSYPYTVTKDGYAAASDSITVSNAAVFEEVIMAEAGA